MEATSDVRIPQDGNGGEGTGSAGFPLVNTPNSGQAGRAAAKRPGSRASVRSDATSAAQTADDSGVMDERNSKTAAAANVALRAQLHELKHVLRQKKAVIATLEQKAGLPPGSTERTTGRPARGRNSLPASGAVSLSPLMGGRLRTSSMERSVDVSSRASSVAEDYTTIDVPLGDVSNAASSSSIPRRRRKDANSPAGIANGRGTTTPEPGNNGNGNMLGLDTVPEANRARTSLGEGFLSPTIASENRRLANTGGAAMLESPITASPNAFAGPGAASSPNSRGTSKVIESLTTELNSTRVALDETRAQLRTSQRTVTTLQKSLDEAREALSRSRTENDASGRMLTRKDRLHQEVLERARKAEAESKELGKSSREWGARVRKVEAELGEERILKQRAEVQYDAIAATWKQTREAWEKEMKELRMTHGETAKRNRATLDEIERRYKQVDDEGKVLRDAVALLEQERKQAAASVVGPVRVLAEQLEQHEAHTASHDAAVENVQAELKRILRLMRTHT